MSRKGVIAVQMTREELREAIREEWEKRRPDDCPKPPNPYRKGSRIWALMEEDWSDLTVTQIAEVMGCAYNTIAAQLRRIRLETGYVVPVTHQRRPAGYWKE